MRLMPFLPLFFIMLSPLFGYPVEERLKNVSQHEQICMRRFFDFAIKLDQAAHVLCFENKAVCLTGVVIRDKHRTFEDVLRLKGWYAFKKNEATFPHPNFIFNEKVYVDDSLELLDIYIINKKALIKCLSLHSDLFKQILGMTFTPTKFLTDLENGQLLPSLIQNNDILLGLLLGFGEEASRAFSETQKDVEGSAPAWSETYSGIDARQPAGCKIYSIGFMGNPKSYEIRKLISVYDAELEEIWKVYKKEKDPLKMALKRLCGENA
jgi:hypothetical protein